MSYSLGTISSKVSCSMRVSAMPRLVSLILVPRFTIAIIFLLCVKAIPASIALLVGLSVMSISRASDFAISSSDREGCQKPFGSSQHPI